MDMPRATGWTALETLGISGLAERVYLALLTRRMATAAEVAGLLRLRQSLVRQSLAQIEHKGLASHTPQSPRVYIAVEPNCAIDALLKQRQMALEQVRAAIPAMARNAVPDSADHEQQPILELITDIAHLQSVLEQMYESFQSEIMIFRRAPTLVPSVRIPEALPPGVRTISDQTFMETPGALASLRQAMDRGEQVRAFTALPFKMMIVDRAVALISLDRTQSGPAVRFLIQRGALLEALCLLFECIWEASTPIVAAPRHRSAAREGGAGPEGSAGSVIPLLAAGLNDKAITQELGISASTLNRRIAELMITFGAKTRFQLGLQVGLHGGLAQPSGASAQRG